METLIFQETTTIGIRRHPCQRTKLLRQHVTVETPYGPIRVKVSAAEGVEYTAMPEFEDCLRAAKAHHIAIKEAQIAAVEAYRQSKRP